MSSLSSTSTTPADSPGQGGNTSDADLVESVLRDPVCADSVTDAGINEATVDERLGSPTSIRSSLHSRHSQHRIGVAPPVSMVPHYPDKQIGLLSSVRILFLGSYLNVLLVFIPITFMARFVQGNTSNELLPFTFLALLPTAKIFGTAMEGLTYRLNPHLGRFLRILAGNSIEFVSGVSIDAQRRIPGY
ncbi:hypothetical protein R3P38DRAFT_3108563 [Favolaschia claudopus]|uniref:Uncharacterized protein n=1 Tax=Favolaschia claudopus TaxID=2862362 RepID=A0AAV9ZHW0_9AGAR